MGLDLERECPANTALTVRPGTSVITGEKSRPRKSPFEGFPLGLVRDSYLDVLSRTHDLGDELVRNQLAAESVHRQIERNAQRGEVPREMRTWLVQCTQNVLTVVDSVWTSENHLELKFEVIDELVAFDNQDKLEWTIWGGVFANETGAVRLLQMLCFNDAAGKDIPVARVRTAARVLADGLATHRPGAWGALHVPNPRTLGEAERVMVELIGVVDASYRLLLDTSAEQARQQFLEVLPKARLLAVGGQPRACRNCIKCQARQVCSLPVKRPGLLGLEGISPYPRVLTPSSLSEYRTCPHLSFLKNVLGLSAPYMGAPNSGESPAQRRGRLAHAWFARAYERGIRCTPADVPDPKTKDIGEVATDLGWGEAEYLDVHPWLLAHTEACPLNLEHPTPTCPEVDVIVKDTDADLLVIARPDLLYSENERINWREFKTVTAPVAHHPDDFLQAYPQLPLAICMLADKAIEGELATALNTTEPGDVELELIWPGGARVISWAANDPATVSRARHLVAEMVDGWAFDQEWQPSASPPCRWCSMASMCEFANSSPGAIDELPAFDPSTGEVLISAKELEQASKQMSPTAIALGLNTAFYLEESLDDEVAF
jgi:hypothetical protein